MDKSTPRAASQVFITNFENFELVYCTKEKQVVSRFQGSTKFAWNASDEQEEKRES